MPCNHKHCKRIKNGRHSATGKQKLHCAVCGRSFTSRYRNKFAKAEIKAKVIRLLDANRSIRSIANELGVSPTSVWTLKQQREKSYQALIARPYPIPKHVLHVVQWSGGKDSSALLIWALEHLPRHRLKVVFCDTGWESPITYEFVHQVNQSLLNSQLITLRSDKYTDLLDLAAQKRRFPSPKARFCTEQLKIYPFLQWLIQQKEDVAVYQGIRASESLNRSKMQQKDDYLKRYRTYQDDPYTYEYTERGTIKKRLTCPILYPEVSAWMKNYDCSVERPLFHWNTEDVLRLCRNNHVLNPLYEMGFSRVGCFPCIMERKEGIKRLAKLFPNRISQIAQAEQTMDSTFFGYGKVPDSQCLQPTIQDVVKWADGSQAECTTASSSCMSHLQQCE